ncbi:MAG: hypothetical protein WAU60_07240 [Candidatus Competibacter denitrificans]|jgi:hypothetical protein|uniref:Uncharacterized protein n=1 Tax=Candidatus Competibacter denitrificans Run_A_D11 TaxID=1400863 RepID=W6M4S4_9GAMM|nr:hypothetical protein [Candidatus Competibacter denitrificans]CDI01604.1 hypothetical protein BN873_170020 [Candidatus Competibacter denitrificans Run_A_D11]HAS85234.1 hypothetical protein [Candidatus Competibacteraceae bacterium]HRC70501.1 hypothetical protein [Candidatus Competibacter denitrificans]
MGGTSGQESGFDSALKAVRRYLLEKGNRFDRGPSYEGNGEVLASVSQAVRMYETLGYTKLMEFGHPPTYAVLERGHREVHIFQPQDPKIKDWLENDQATLNDPPIRAYFLEKSGLPESDLPAPRTPRQFHINEVDNVFIVSTDERA